MGKLSDKEIENIRKMSLMFNTTFEWEGVEVSFDDAISLFQGEQPSNLSLDERRKEFGQQVGKFVGEYEREMLLKFYHYWSAQDGVKLKYEKEKTWDLPKRIANWKRNEDEYSRRDYIKEINKKI